MNPFEELFKSKNAPLGAFSWAQIIAALTLAFALSYLAMKFYERFGRTAATPSNMGSTLVILALTITFIMEVVGNSVARAFSLAGALSIVRFRNAIKETEDIAIIFLVMAIGISCGSGFFLLAAISTVFILLVWLFLKKDRPRLDEERRALLSVRARSVDEVERAVDEAGVKKVLDHFELLQTRIDSNSGEGVYVFQIGVRKRASIEQEVLRPLAEHQSITDVSLYHSPTIDQ